MSGRQSKRQRRAEEWSRADEVWTDQEFGIRLEVNQRGRALLTWRTPGSAVFDLIGSRRLRQLLDDFDRETVLGLREDGFSWDDIGPLLGITGEAARRRYLTDDRAVDEAQEVEP